MDSERKKHDAHVRTAFIHFFPMQLFLVLISLAFTLGCVIGNSWGYLACYSFNLLISK
ncbi:hypothetical protein ACG9ZL_21055 [Acinetobacter sp. ULE_I057]|uniref:hypothetical protein n=1 Tax=Acinetobacter sp. ULE_I057 TaxID=3373070 RepID=UPI003AF4F97E